MSNEALRTEHDAVLAALSTRESTRHLAHAAISGFVAFLLGGTAARLWHDGRQGTPFVVALGLTCAVTLYAVVRGSLGLSAHKKERAQLGRLKELRAQLGVDAPVSVPSTTP